MDPRRESSQLLARVTNTILEARALSTRHLYAFKWSVFCDLVTEFIRGAQRLNPPRPKSVPTWDLSIVLRAFKGHPFEPLQTAGLRPMSLKTAPLALTSVKQVGDLQVMSVSTSCLEFGPNDCKIILQPRSGYIPKVLSTLFTAKVISLLALPTTDGQAGCQIAVSCSDTQSVR